MELALGANSGDLSIFKYDKSTPWRVAKNLGFISAITIGKLRPAVSTPDPNIKSSGNVAPDSDSDPNSNPHPTSNLDSNPDSDPNATPNPDPSLNANSGPNTLVVITGEGDCHLFDDLDKLVVKESERSSSPAPGVKEEEGEAERSTSPSLASKSTTYPKTTYRRSVTRIGPPSPISLFSFSLFDNLAQPHYPVPSPFPHLSLTLTCFDQRSIRSNRVPLP